jgi:hypothetical protein
MTAVDRGMQPACLNCRLQTLALIDCSGWFVGKSDTIPFFASMSGMPVIQRELRRSFGKVRGADFTESSSLGELRAASRLKG